VYWYGYEKFRMRLLHMVAERRRIALHREWQERRIAGGENEEDPGQWPLAQVPLTFVDSFSTSFVAGAGSGIIAGTMSTPFDVVKTRKQAYRAGTVHHYNHSVLPTTTWGILRDIYTHEGVPGLFRGLPPRLMRVAPASAIMISSYELGKRYAQEHADSSALAAPDASSHRISHVRRL